MPTRIGFEDECFIGRPRVHGDKFKLHDYTTWWTPDQIIKVNGPKLGQLAVPASLVSSLLATVC